MTGGGEDPGAPRGRRGSVRTPIIVAVIAANVVTLVLLLVVVNRAVERDREAIADDYARELGEHLDDVVDGLGRIRPSAIMGWRGWRWFDDVIVAQRPLRTRDGEGPFAVEGVYLNPLGRSRRSPDFDEQSALEMIERAARENVTFDAGAMGAAAPIGRPGMEPWGGAWFVKRPVTLRQSPVSSVLPLFLLTLLGVTLLVLTLLRRMVLEPIGALSGAAARLASGDLSARIDLPGERTDELGALAEGFNAMAFRVQRQRADLEEAVERATGRARSAEAAAMTQRRLAATGELAAGIAHELNNPLGGLLNAVEALRREDLPVERRERYLDLVQGGLERMGETVGRLLRLSPRSARIEDVDVVRPLSDAMGLVAHRAEAMGVTIRVSLSGGDGLPVAGLRAAGEGAGLPMVRGSSNDLGQAFLNLAVNALDAIESAREDGTARPGGGAVDVAVGTFTDPDLGPALRVVFEDDGPGMGAEVAARAADPFFTTKGQGKGSGLGLAIVHNVVAAHGGSVLLDGRPGRGLRVEIILPAAASEETPGEVAP